MTLNEYQDFTTTTDKENDFRLYTYGLLEEAGEVAGKFKRLYREHKGELVPELRQQILTELGDMKWYASRIAHYIGATDEEVAQINIDKLNSRKARGVLHGSGDSR